MNIARKLKPEFFLRLGLAGTFIYSGTDLVRNPANWKWALDSVLVKSPAFVEDIVNNTVGAEKFLQMHGVAELLFAALLLLWFIPKKLLKITTLFITLEFALILLMTGIDSITFRDIGLLGASLALLSIAYRK